MQLAAMQSLLVELPSSVLAFFGFWYFPVVEPLMDFLF